MLKCSVEYDECKGIECTNSPMLPTEDVDNTQSLNESVSQMVKCAFLCAFCLYV